MPSSNYEPTDSDEENLDDDESEDYLESESDDEDPDYFETASPSEGTNGHQQSVAQQKQVMIIKRQTALPASPGSHSFATSFAENYNHEAYLLANTRLKFKSAKSQQVVANDSRRAKKPRKGTRGLGGKKKESQLPERVPSNFSVTKETARAVDACTQVLNSKHDTEIRANLESKIIPDFPRWMSFMWEGFNIILYGFGSKLAVVDSFNEYLQENFNVFRINGLCPKLSARKVMSDFVDTLELGIKAKGVCLEAISEEVCNKLPVDHPPVFMIVQNFDTLAASNSNVVTIICSLAQIPWIHVLATTDNINASLGLTQSQCVQLNFCWIPCSTFQPYAEEFSWTANIFGESTNSKGTENTLQYVLKSLTGNARKAFSILASLQLEKLRGIDGKKGKDFAGVEFADLARKCKDSFVAHNDSVLRTLLVEFVDHKLITTHQGKRKGVNSLTIDLSIEVLQKIVTQGI
ncbi:origin recognition complex subunit 2 [Folsomia candida]|uniref:origin recognition complex subunit 2 n=1 Tax=Folsomia candida TaxID=158441 RepID=UPI000B8F23B2|nr:origin recognition complex subunit 2 [Folsomia candida]